MKFSAIELGIINAVLSNIKPEEQDQEVAKEIYRFLQERVNKETSKFEEGEMDLKASHRAWLVKFLPKAGWNAPQLVELVDPLIERLNA